MIIDKLQNLGVREKTLITLAVVAVFAAVIVLAIFYPALSRIKVVDKAIFDAEKTMDLYEGVLKLEKDVVEKQYASISGLLGKSREASADIAVLKGVIDGLANDIELPYTSMKHRDPAALGDSNAPYNEFFVEIGGIKSDMEKLLRFLSDVRQQKDMLRIARVNIKTVKGTDQVAASVWISKVMIPTANQDAEINGGEEK